MTRELQELLPRLLNVAETAAIELNTLDDTTFTQLAVRLYHLTKLVREEIER